MVICALSAAFSGLFFYFIGLSQKGKAMEVTNELPDTVFFRIIYVDKISCILETIDVSRERFYVSRALFFGDTPIRAGVTVRKAQSYKDQCASGSSTRLGFAPLVVVTEEEA